MQRGAGWRNKSREQQFKRLLAKHSNYSNTLPLQKRIKEYSMTGGEGGEGLNAVSEKLGFSFFGKLDPL